MTTYRIVRNYFNNGNRVIARGLTLEEAQEHCRDPETSSSTASDKTLANEKRDTKWFDGYDEE